MTLNSTVEGFEPSVVTVHTLDSQERPPPPHQS